MEWKLAALATLVAAAFAGALLLRRYGGAGRRTGLVCLRCGAPAADLASFTCPVCHHDVREAGIGPPRGHAPLARFWHALLFTTAYLILASVIVRSLTPRIPATMTAAYHVSINVSSPGVAAVDLFLDGRAPERDGAQLAGMLTGDLYAAVGVATLRADLPTMRWELTDFAGREIESGQGLDGTVVSRWVGYAGVDTDTPAGRSDVSVIAAAIGRLTGTRIELPAAMAEAPPLSYSSSVTGGSGVRRDERGVPVIVMGLTALWLGGMWLALALPAGHAGGRRRDKAAVPPGEGTA